MASLTAAIVRSVFGPSPKLLCDAKTWRFGVAELKRRTLGRRESGAFLLGTKSKNVCRIKEFVFYDDIDPNALATGIVLIDGRLLGSLWDRCRKTGQTVVADVHVHPGGFRQSASDKANPIIAEVGHIAIILPYYANRDTMPPGIGVHEYLGARQWRDHSDDRKSIFHIGWWPWR